MEKDRGSEDAPPAPAIPADKEGSSAPVVSVPVGEKSQEVAESAWVLLTNLPARASWNKVRGVFSDIGCSVLIGKVKRDKRIAVVKLSSAADAIKAEAEVSGKTFNDIPDAPIQARQIAESERSAYEES